MTLRRFLGIALCLLISTSSLQAQPATRFTIKQAPLMTPWSSEVTPDNALPEYPRPIMSRPQWQNLNGLWEFSTTTEGAAPAFGKTLPEQILVPYPIESALSGVMKPAERAWYRRTFTLPTTWKGQRTLLHFGAVDFEATVYVNGKKMGSHRGGYDGFSFDITPALRPSGPQEIFVEVWDPTDKGVYARGKQVNNPGGIFYTPVTGIWQTVWLEPVPAAHIDYIHTTPDIDQMTLRVHVDAVGVPANAQLRVRATNSGKVLGTAQGKPGQEIVVRVPAAKLWTPDTPVLNDLKIELVAGGKVVDAVDSYFGMRKIALGKDEKGITRLMLNNKFVFQLGPLDQGYWPDGLYTAPTDAALRFDIEAAKQMGFNMIRKHAKVEPQRWYYWTDKLGMLVWQDMPQVNPDDFARRQTAEHRQQFEAELKELGLEHNSHPSIVMWTVFNEGWGQYDTERLTRWTKSLDPTRIVSNASGWVDYKVGDVIDMHRYPGPGAFPAEPDRASVLGEFGGLGLPVELHMWTSKDNWGYQAFSNFSDLRDRYALLFDDLWPLVDQGLSAAVYTQTTDVETESNGLLTYDRQVWKIPAADLRAFHTDRMVSIPHLAPEGTLFLNAIQVTLSNRKGEQIRYTTDGTEPTVNSTLYSGPITLNRTATITARSFNTEGQPSASMKQTYTLAPAPRPAARVTTAPGLSYAYYEGNWDLLPDFKALSPVATGTTEKVDLTRRRQNDHIGFVFTGYVEAPKDGIYTFYLESDDGSRLYLGDTRLIENDGIHGMETARGQVALAAGRHPIRVEFFERASGEGLSLRWSGPGFAEQEIPASALSHTR